MFLRAKTRKKDGKNTLLERVENRRVAGGRVVQRHVLYLGEINSSQELAWRRSIEVLETASRRRAPTRCLRRIAARVCCRTSRSCGSNSSCCNCTAAAVGRVLVGADAVADSGSGRVLGRAIAAVAQGTRWTWCCSCWQRID